MLSKGKQNLLMQKKKKSQKAKKFSPIIEKLNPIKVIVTA